MSAEPPPAPPAAMAERVVAFCEELRREGVAVGTSEILDSFDAISTVPWTDRADFREALAATVAKSQEDRRVFELIFDRYFFRATESEALERALNEAQNRFEGGERLDLDELRQLLACGRGPRGVARSASAATPAADRRALHDQAKGNQQRELSGHDATSC